MKHCRFQKHRATDTQRAQPAVSGAGRLSLSVCLCLSHLTAEPLANDPPKHVPPHHGPRHGRRPIALAHISVHHRCAAAPSQQFTGSSMYPYTTYCCSVFLFDVHVESTRKKMVPLMMLQVPEANPAVPPPALPVLRPCFQPTLPVSLISVPYLPAAPLLRRLRYMDLKRARSNSD